MNYCFIIPHFKHYDAFAKFLPRLVKLGITCIIVDDGSDSPSIDKLEELLFDIKKTSDAPELYLLKHSFNRGKGAAFFTGAYYARALGYTHAIQIDADGQHDLKDVADFIEYSNNHPDTIVSGKPYFEDDAPKVRVYGRRVTDFWVALETLSLQIKDSLCGYRVYPLQQVEHILDAYHIGVRMDFDTEMLVKAVWLDIPLHFMPTKVIYPEGAVSHFNYTRDNFLLISLHIKLIFGMLVRSPFFIIRNIKKLKRVRG